MKYFLLLPNLLTLSRIFLIFPALVLIEKEIYNFASLIILILFLTDFFDGQLARKLNQVTQVGSILDPIADKLVVISFFTYFYLHDKVPLVYFLIVMVRDISQLSVIPVLIFWKKILFKVKPKLIPKIGTALNFIIFFLIFLSLIVRELLEKELYNFLMDFLFWTSGAIEVYILVTFFPRYYKIYTGKHDTFE
jgi:CDP-diacylglycerol--glycerol-3-phosphate 3-phosphatidyltransferase